MFKTADEISAALAKTGQRLLWSNSDEYALLVCGGSALNLLGILARPTKDVDVLGIVKGSNASSVAKEFLPDEIKLAASTVARELGLPDDWLNDSAIDVHAMGLPEGILKRAEKRAFGPCLTIHLISRLDQVALKLYAALDPKGQRHLKDLDILAPTKSELEFAVQWLLDRKVSPDFANAVKKLVAAFGLPTSRPRKTGHKSQRTPKPKSKR